MPKAGDHLVPHRVDAVKNENIMEWSRILNDPNPIHLDPKAASASGLGSRTVNQGPANLGAIINLIVSNFPDGTIEVLDISFIGNVFSGDFMEATGRITDISRSTKHVTYYCDVELRSNNGVALSGKVEVTVPDNTCTISDEHDDDR